MFILVAVVVVYLVLLAVNGREIKSLKPWMDASDESYKKFFNSF